MNNRAGYYFSASRALEVRFDDEVPKEIHALVRPVIEQEMWLLPSWLQLLFVRYTTPNDNHTSMSTTPNEEYRSGTLYIHPSWINGNEGTRATEIRHEFIHFPIDTLAEVIQEVINLQTNEDVKRILGRDLRKAVERCVVDLEQAITHKIDAEPSVKRGP